MATDRLKVGDVVVFTMNVGTQSVEGKDFYLEAGQLAEVIWISHVSTATVRLIWSFDQVDDVVTVSTVSLALASPDLTDADAVRDWLER